MKTPGLRLLMFNLAVDADDPILGFAITWINELAQYCQYIDVVTMRAGRLRVAENVRVHSVGRERGYSEFRRALRFYRILLRLLFSRRYDACFAHMMPLFAGMGGPLLRLWRIPVTLWYVHRQVSFQLRLGLAMSYRVVTAAPSTFPLKTDKLRPLGHGIDTDFFSPDTSISRTSPPIILHIGRLTPIKNQHALLEAIKDLDARAVLVGDVPDGYDSDYKQWLIELVDQFGIGDRIVFAGNQTPEGVRDWLRQASIHVNLTEAGSFDKAVIEAMSCAVPTITCNPGFHDLVAGFEDMLLFASPDDIAGLSGCLRKLLSLPEIERCRIGFVLRECVVERHSRRRLIAKIARILETGEPQDE